MVSLWESLSEKSSETYVDWISYYPTLEKIEGGIREPCPFHSIIYKMMPEGAFDYYFDFLLRVSFPLEAKFAKANFLSEAVIVLELTPGKFKNIVSITWFINPLLTI